MSERYQIPFRGAFRLSLCAYGVQARLPGHDSERCFYIPAARKCPSDASSSPSRIKRAQGTPDAGRTRGSCVQGNVHFTHASNDRAAEQPAFPAQWLRLIRDLPGVPGLSSHRRLAFVTQGLIPASGDRDRTISPYAIRASSLRAPRPSHPAPNVRDDREPPLWREQDGQEDKGDLGFWKSELFFAAGLEQAQLIEPACEISFSAQRILAAPTGSTPARVRRGIGFSEPEAGADRSRVSRLVERESPGPFAMQSCGRQLRSRR